VPSTPASADAASACSARRAWSPATGIPARDSLSASAVPTGPAPTTNTCGVGVVSAAGLDIEPSLHDVGEHALRHEPRHVLAATQPLPNLGRAHLWQRGLGAVVAGATEHDELAPPRELIPPVPRVPLGE